MYFVTMDHESGRLAEFTLVPMQINHFRLNRAPATDAAWLHRRIDRECARFDISLQSSPDRSLEWVTVR